MLGAPKGAPQAAFTPHPPTGFSPLLCTPPHTQMASETPGLPKTENTTKNSHSTADGEAGFAETLSSTGGYQAHIHSMTRERRQAEPTPRPL